MTSDIATNPAQDRLDQDRLDQEWREERAEWLESLDGLIAARGPERSGVQQSGVRRT